MKTKVKAKTQPTEKQKMERAHEAVQEIHRTNAEAREAIDRYLKQRGVTMDSLSDQSDGFRKDCYGAVRDALQSGDWSKLTHVQRFDPLTSVPAQEPAAKADPVEVAATVVEESEATPEMLSQNKDSNHAALLQQAIEEMVASRVNKPAIDERRFKELFDHEIQNGIEWDKTGVVKLLDERVEAARNGIARRIEIFLPDGKKRETERQHKGFDTLLKLCSLRKNVMLVGPAASGKTTVAENVAKVLDLPFHPMSIGLQTSKGDLMGVKFADGSYQPSPLRKAYEHGGVVLLDEFDAGHAGVNTIINAATANAVCGFPDGTVKRHKDFICIVAMNTWGWGANDQYVGRNKLDAATLDRFLKLPWEYDEDLEREIAGNREWTDRVQALRRAAGKVQAKVLISPRASINGADLLAAGFDWDEVENMTIWNGVDRATKEKVLSNVE